MWIFMPLVGPQLVNNSILSYTVDTIIIQMSGSGPESVGAVGMDLILWGVRRGWQAFEMDREVGVSFQNWQAKKKYKIKEGHLASNHTFPASMFKFQLFNIFFYQREWDPGVGNLNNNNNINNRNNKYKFLIFSN